MVFDEAGVCDAHRRPGTVGGYYL